MKNNRASQPSLIKKDIPKIPEGYYSSGPNPNLKAFVEQHATTYDSKANQYEINPFNEQISTTKAKAIYNMQGYHKGKKPNDAIMQYIKHCTKTSDLVLYPFCGSDSTALAAMITDRKAIAIDLPPAAHLRRAAAPAGNCTAGIWL
jgi:DNA modification methylase